MRRDLLQVELLLDGSLSLREALGDDYSGIDELQVGCHPDLHPGNSDSAKEMFQRVSALADSLRGKHAVVKSPKREYELLGPLATGDAADLYFAVSEGNDYVVKISRNDGTHNLLEAERQSLVALHMAANDMTYRLYIPLLVESFPVRDTIQKRVNVFGVSKGYHPLLAVMKRYPDGLTGRHAVWVYKRLLVGLGFAHRNSIIHGAIVPEHVLIDNENRGAMIVGWGQSVEANNRIKYICKDRKNCYPPEVFAKKPATPETDIFMAAKLAISICAKDVDQRIMAFWNSCLMEGQLMRPGDAWALHDEFTDLLKTVYGRPQFSVLEL